MAARRPAGPAHDPPGPQQATDSELDENAVYHDREGEPAGLTVVDY